jgi:hypothetical protein
MQIGINHHQKHEVKCVVLNSTQLSALKKPEMRLRPTLGDEKPFASCETFFSSTLKLTKSAASALQQQLAPSAAMRGAFPPRTKHVSSNNNKHFHRQSVGARDPPKRAWLDNTH